MKRRCRRSSLRRIIMSFVRDRQAVQDRQVAGVHFPGHYRPRMPPQVVCVAPCRLQAPSSPQDRRSPHTPVCESRRSGARSGFALRRRRLAPYRQLEARSRRENSFGRNPLPHPGPRMPEMPRSMEGPIVDARKRWLQKWHRKVCGPSLPRANVSSCNS